MSKESDDYYRGFYDGFVEGKKVTSYPKPSPLPEFPTPPKVPFTPSPITSDWAKCSVCQLDLKSMTNYCCMHPKCPSRVVSMSNKESL